MDSEQEALEQPAAPDDGVDAGEVAREFVEDVLAAMGFEAEVDVSQDESGTYHVQMRGPEMALIIGRQGSTLDALQYLVLLVVNKRVGQKVRLLLDAEGYRTRREDSLRETARSWAEKVKETGQECVLDPMSAFERRIVHTALADDPDIFTYSEGDEPERCVVISPRSAQPEEAAEAQQTP